MAFPTDASVVVLLGSWWDESTRAGMEATITATPVPAGGSGAPANATPNLTDLANYGWIKSRSWVTKPLASGLYALPLIANDDPDLSAFGGYQISPQGEPSFLVNVSVTATTIAATPEIVSAITQASQLSSATYSVAEGDQIQVVRMTEAAVLSQPAPQPPSAFLTESQVNSRIATAIAESGSGGGTVDDATTTTKGVARLLGGTADAPTIPATALTGTIDDARLPAGITRDTELSAVAAAKAESSVVDGHLANTANPHSVTKAQVGLGNVANTAPADLPVSTATQSALDAKAASSALTTHTGSTSNPHSVTKAQVGLGSVDNVSAASLRDAATHTGQRTAASISDFTEAVQDAVAALLGAGSNITLNYDDVANTLTVTAAGGGGGLDAEAVRDAIGVALVGTGNISVVVNDAADTITVSTTATANSTDAQLRDRSTHTGTQSADSLTDGTTNKAFLAAERTKLSGVAAGATANATDANLRDRTTHTGAQAVSTVTGLQAALDAKAPLASPAFTGTPTGITKGHVGLGNVDNTADTAKPVSTAQQAALDTKTRLSVDGSFVSSYDLDTTPVAPGELSPPAYTRDEVDDLVAGAGGGGYYPPVSVAPVLSQDYTTTTWALIAGLTVPITVTSTADKFEITATLDVAAYAANASSVFIAVLNVTTTATGADVSFPIRIPVANLRLPVVLQWTISGMAAGTPDVRVAGYLTAAGNYQIGTGSTLKAQRIV